MLTLPDFREKKIVFVQAEKDIDHQIRFWNSNIRIYKDGSPVDQISCHIVLALVIVGNTSITSTLIQRAKKFGISILLLNYALRSYAEINSIAEGNTLIRTKQYQMPPEEALQESIELVKNKIGNQAALLQKVKKLDNNVHLHAIQTLQAVTSHQELLGIEGNFSSRYFGSLFAPYAWHRRAPQAKEDVTNVLMDIGYTYLFNYVDAILRLFGFDTYKGFYHQLFFQRKSLACDLMEPVRPIIDYQIVKGYNLGTINAKDFQVRQGCFSLKTDPKIRAKYSMMFFECITRHKEQIYTYLRTYYLHRLDPSRYPFAVFQL